MRAVLVFLIFVFAITVASAQAFAAAEKRLQICTSCQSSACKNLARDIEFELELAEDYLLPPCAKGPLAKGAFRLTLSDNPAQKSVLAELTCQGGQRCLSKLYPFSARQAIRSTEVVSDVKLAVKLKKVVVPEPAKVTPPKSEPAPTPVHAEKPKATKSEEEWDRVILVRPPETKAKSEAPLELVAEAQALKEGVGGSVAVSVGAENWSYQFDGTQNKDVASFNSRLYPKLMASAHFWPLSYLRLSSQLGGALLSFRLKANQPVDGDGQLIFAHKYDGDLSVYGAYPILTRVRVGVDVAYAFVGASVDNQRLAEKTVVLVPSYQSHQLRIGGRTIIGEEGDRASLEVGASLYPYLSYNESPDEVTTQKSIFAWRVDAKARLSLAQDLVAEAQLAYQSLKMHEDGEVVRETAGGEKWGHGTTLSSTFCVGLGVGWLF